MTTPTLRFLELHFVLWFFYCPVSFCEATEEKALAKLESLEAKITKNREGKLATIFWGLKTFPPRGYLTDEDIESVDFSVLTGLRRLTVISPGITDRSVSHLLKMNPELDSLTFVAAKLTDKPLGRLIKRQQSLYSLSFQDVPITDDVIPDVSALRDLRLLCLDGTKITDKGMKELAKMKLLISLQLSRTSISDAGLAEVSKMTGLIGLSLDGTKVTDKGILQLANLPKLQLLKVSSTKVTEDGKKALQQMLPKLEFTK